jgi:hypothetical protein
MSSVFNYRLSGSIQHHEILLYLETKWVTSSISGLEEAASVSGRRRWAQLKSLHSLALGTGRGRARATNLF